MKVSPALAEEEVINYFSGSYQAARIKFTTAAKAAGADLEHYPNPAPGAEGEKLYTDTATFNLPGVKQVLVLSSGTHGIEGFAGSAIQTGLLREGITRILPKDIGLLFIHALNPYGFSHLRRFTEDNVDLNRNFVDHGKPYPPNEGYNKLARVIEPESLSTLGDIQAKLVLTWYRATKGKQWLQAAISQGQYNHPKGIFFGGNKQTWSNHTLQHITEQYLSSASHVIMIDLHTGIGAYGAAEVISVTEPGTPTYERILKWWGNRVKSPYARESVSLPLSGSLKHGVTQLLPKVEVTAVSLEFGTFPMSEVLRALRAENYLYHHRNTDHPDAPTIKAELKRVFYPDENDWKLTVWQQGKEVVEQVLTKLR